jgi:hypothetical protein
MRLTRLVVTDTSWGTVTRHDFSYGAGGRLARVEFRISVDRGGPPVRLTRYVEHAYDGERLVRSDFHGLATGGGFTNFLRVSYAHDGRGRIAAETTQRLDVAQPPETLTYSYDGQGRLSRVAESNHDETTRFSYDGTGSLRSAEAREVTGNVIRSTYAHDTGRNPFYGNHALDASLIVPVHLWPMLLSPHNMLRQEIRANSSSAVVSSITHEYSYDPDGRPRRLRQVIRNDVDPSLPVTVLFYDFEYEPVPG